METFTKSKLTKITSAISSTEYTNFDGLGRLSTHQQTTDGNVYTTAYVYNLSGAMLEETYPSGRVVKNTLDQDGDLSQVQSKKANDTFKNYANSFNYTASGAVSSLRLGNGRWENTTFNNRLQPTQIGLGTSATNQSLLKLNYDYGATDNNGNIKSQTITVPTIGANQGFTAVQTYVYDSLNRLKSATENINGNQTPNWKQTYQYDRYGNRRFDTANGNTTTLPANCQTTICNPEISTANNRLIGTTYDNGGNTTTDASGRTFIYDGENKQTKVQNGATVVGEYSYDGDGKRIKKIVPSTGEITIFVYDASGKMVAEYSTIVEPKATAKISYLTNDHLQSPRIITDQNGAIVSKRDFMPFGEEIQRTNYGNDNVREKFATYERDAESNLDFAQARMYLKSLGRFTTTDPLSESGSADLPQTWNRYIYCLNNPLLFIDPTGMVPTDYVDTESGTITHIDDGKDQVIALSKDGIDKMVDLSNKDMSQYRAILKIWEENDQTNLHLTRHEFMVRAATTYAESSFFRSDVSRDDLANEMKGIAWVNTRNNVAYGATSDSAKAYNNTAFNKQTDAMKLANLAIVNQRQGGPDPSNGANGWDGREQALYPDSDKRASVPNPKNRRETWELRKNTGGWSISDVDYAKWKQNVGSAFKAPQNSPASVGPNKGKIRYYSTAVYGNTIFWRIQ